MSKERKLEDNYSNLHENEEHNEKIEYLHGKKRKYGTTKKYSENNSLWQQYPAISKDRSVALKIINQPEVHHRARYQTEGSRGAIKDKTGTSYPSVVLKGYKKKTILQIYIGSDSGRIGPHLFYQACKVTGKNSTPCKQTNIDGTDVIQVELSAANINDIVVCDCVGILKERYADVEQRFPNHKSIKSNKKKSTRCRIVFRITIENNDGHNEILQVISDVINCTQVPGTPEILKMSTNTCIASGGGELWIIGKNFLKETKVVFTYLSKETFEKSWTKIMEPDRTFFHPTHLITKIPPFRNTKISDSIEVHVYVKCADKFSDPHILTYFPISPVYNGNMIERGCRNLELPQGVSIPAVRINQQFAKTGAVCLASSQTKTILTSETSSIVSQPVMTCETTSGNSRLSVRCQNTELASSRPTILEHLDNASETYRLDFGLGAGLRRTQSVPRPAFICEDTMFDWVEASQSDQRRGQALKNQNQNSPWGLRESIKSKTSPSSFKGSFNRQKISSHISNPTEESNSCNFTRDSVLDESSMQSTQVVDVSSDLTTDFSDTVAIVSNQYQSKSDPSLSWCTIENKEGNREIIQETKSDNLIDSKSSNISYKKSDTEKATISISLPPSILQDKNQLKSVIQTINKTLLAPTETISDTKPVDSTSEAIEQQSEEQYSNFSQPLLTNINWSNESGGKQIISDKEKNPKRDQHEKRSWTNEFPPKSSTWIDSAWKDPEENDNATWPDNIWIQNKETTSVGKKWPSHSVSKIEEVKVGAYVDGYIKGQEDANKKNESNTKEWCKNTSPLWHKNDGEKWQPPNETKPFWNVDNISEKEWMEEPIAKKTAVWRTKSDNTNWINPVINQNDWQDETKLKPHALEHTDNITQSQFAISDPSKRKDSKNSSSSSTMCQKFNQKAIIDIFEHKASHDNCAHMFEESTITSKGNPLLSEASSAIAVQQDIATNIVLNTTKSPQTIEPQTLLQDWCFSESN